ncbi:unnamed protein product [Staurois parvus]|uniref:Secreted protein n=1 Tax=Staurois parvus TaxID=386267 RepID=A0ABN9EJX7_9NEOB|nr:unnamed protein product [Staurois parvus]
MCAGSAGSALSAHMFFLIAHKCVATRRLGPDTGRPHICVRPRRSGPFREYRTCVLGVRSQHICFS